MHKRPQQGLPAVNGAPLSRTEAERFSPAAQHGHLSCAGYDYTRPLPMYHQQLEPSQLSPVTGPE